MSSTSEEKFRGIANLFDKTELKKFILNYLIALLVVEALIFFVSFVVHLASAGEPFPWRGYVYASFIAPVVMTFMLGVIILFFNKYLYDHAPASSSEVTNGFGGDLSLPSKLQLALNITRQVPFLLGLLMLIAVSGLIYKLDAILIFIGQAGERVALYMLAALDVLLAVVAIFVMVWMYLSYRLRRDKLKHQYQYQRDVTERLGLVILDDNRVFDRANPQKKISDESHHEGNDVTVIDAEEPENDKKG